MRAEPDQKRDADDDPGRRDGGRVVAEGSSDPWGLRVPLSPMIGRSQLAWLDYGLRALADTGLSESEKADVILLVNGYVFWQARLFEEIGRPPGGGEAPASYSDMLAGLLERERYPALHRALDARILDDDSDPEADFRFGLDRVLDGIECLVEARGG